MDLLGLAWTLAKEIGKGGGGSTDEPTVCFALLPVGLGVLFVGLRDARQAILKRLEEGRPLRRLGDGEESPDSTERGARRKPGSGNRQLEPQRPKPARPE